MSTGHVTTPSCEATRLPLPVVHQDLGNQQDFHHHFHPRRCPELTTVVGGRALRYARGQDLDKSLHARYHRIFTGPELPDTEEERFRLCVLACAGMVPRQGIDLNGGKNEYQIIDLSEEQYARIADPATMHMERKHDQIGRTFRRRVIGEFFAHYALKQDIATIVSRKVIYGFLDADGARRVELGNFILKNASDAMVQDLIPLYEQLIDGGYTTDPNPFSVARVVRNYFIKASYPKFYDGIAASLAKTA